MRFSFVIPVYNRPNEVDELLASLSEMDYHDPYEIVIVEDGSTINCREVVDRYRDRLKISYFYKENTGPGHSRNFGMQLASGDYFILVDSDCLVPPDYLTQINKSLSADYVDCFGGPDQAMAGFSTIQKAINFTMVSFLTTGGIRGGSERVGKFQPRSFNMGISKQAFEASKGFADIHPGEDPDLSIRLWDLGFKTKLIKEAYVYHKRRIDWTKFYIQVNKFGKVRAILDKWHPRYAKLTFWFPTLFMTGLLASCAALAFGIPYLLYFYIAYFILLFLSAIRETKSISVSLYAMVSVVIQFYGYGTGFLKSFWKVRLMRKNPEVAFPELFFKRR